MIKYGHEEGCLGVRPRQPDVLTSIGEDIGESPDLQLDLCRQVGVAAIS